MIGGNKMNKNEFIKKVDEKIKLIRNERSFTQDKMAEILGISKKTLLQVEKHRGTLGWTTTVAVCTIFKDSEILQLAFGGDPREIILSLAFTNYQEKYGRTFGGKVWWKDIKILGKYKIQQNIISQHYRILDGADRRICYSFEISYIYARLEELNK